MLFTLSKPCGGGGRAHDNVRGGRNHQESGADNGAKPQHVGRLAAGLGKAGCGRAAAEADRRMAGQTGWTRGRCLFTWYRISGYPRASTPVVSPPMQGMSAASIEFCSRISLKASVGQGRGQHGMVGAHPPWGKPTPCMRKEFAAHSGGGTVSTAWTHACGHTIAEAEAGGDDATDGAEEEVQGQLVERFQPGRGGE